MSISKALSIVEEMFADRGYTFQSKQEKLLFYKTKNEKYVLFTIINSTSNIKNFSSFINNDRFETIFFLFSKNNINCSHKVIEKTLNYKIEIWSINNLQINVSKHFLQPNIELVASVPGKIPRISFYDPIIRYYRYEHKSTIKITNSDGIIHYRLIV